MKLIMMDDLDMRVHKKLTYFLKINTNKEMEGVCCAVLFERGREEE
jgi:hypothetical protein